MLSFVSLTSGHVPVDSDNNTNLENAEKIKNPTKSWAIYGHVNPNQNHYYVADFNTGETLYVSLSKAIRDENDNFSPQIIISSKEFTQNPILSSSIEVPENYGWIKINNDQDREKEYEPFGPSYFYSITEFEYDVPENNRYYIIINSIQEGYYLLAVGSTEQFTLQEWFFTPIQMISVYQWEGQSWFLIVIPWFLTVIFSFYVYFVRNPRNIKNLQTWKKIILSMSIPFYGSSTQYLSQIIISSYFGGLDPAILISLILGLFPFLVGLYIFTILTKQQQTDITLQLKLIGSSIIGLILWAGYIVFPLAIIVFSLALILTNGIKKLRFNNQSLN
jgi:hypothetical protein